MTGRHAEQDRSRGAHRSSAHFFFFQAEDGIRDLYVTGVQTCALPISRWSGSSVAMVAWNCCRKVAVGVMVATDEVQRSLAPSRMVTYCAPWATACPACLAPSDILAPVTASMNWWPPMAGLTARRRS